MTGWPTMENDLVAISIGLMVLAVAAPIVAALMESPEGPARRKRRKSR